MNKLTVNDLDVDGKRVLCRVDFNVPIADGKVTGDQRIVAALPTLNSLLNRGASLILMSHLGRPKGKPNPEYSLRPVAQTLEAMLGRPVAFVEDCVGAEASAAAAALKPGEVLLLENLRFHPGEQDPSAEPDFAYKLACLGDAYVNDAFGTAHRAHASMVPLAAKFDRPAAGFLMAKEIEYFSKALSKPERPFVAVLGGAKVSDKIQVIESLLKKVDTLLVGGAMAYTFLAAKGIEVGASRVESDRLDTAREVLERAGKKKVELLLPVDHICGEAFEEGSAPKAVDGEAIPAGWMGLDIGPKTAAAYEKRIEDAGTVIWNGPMGVFEWPAFAAGTLGLAKACAESKAVTIVGGGDSAAAAEQSGYAEKIDHISTGGGASLELLEGKTLPGLAALADR